LDIKNPSKKEVEEVYDRNIILKKLDKSFQDAILLLNDLKK
jgi:hypothetical protein